MPSAHSGERIASRPTSRFCSRDGFFIFRSNPDESKHLAGAQYRRGIVHRSDVKDGSADPALGQVTKQLASVSILLASDIRVINLKPLANFS